MYEGNVPLKDFLDTLNRLQADFEQRLGGIERQALPTPLGHARLQERSGWSACAQDDGYRPLGLEAIWTSPRASSGERPSGQRDPISPRYVETLLDQPPEETFPLPRGGDSRMRTVRRKCRPE